MAVCPDQDRMRLFAQWIASQQLRRGESRADHVALCQSTVRDTREEVLVQVAESLSIRREALVAETLEEVARIEGQRPPGIVALAEKGEALEPVGIELEPDVSADPE